MASFTYRILPPHVEFWDTVEPEELALMARYLDHLRRLREDGTEHFVARARNGRSGFMLIEAESEAHANALAEGHPAVIEGLMRLDLHTSLVVVDGARALQQETAS